MPTFTPLLGVDMACLQATQMDLPLEVSFEHGLMVLEGEATVNGQALKPGSLLYLEPGVTSLSVKTDAPARILMLGGEPWEKPPLLWWNFVGRTREEIEQFTAEWNGLTGNFAGVQVTGYVGDRLTAPPVPAIR